MEIAQHIYRGRGLYTDPATGQKVSGDHISRRLVMLISQYVVSFINEADIYVRRGANRELKTG
jgi:hypothetical protein